MWFVISIDGNRTLQWGKFDNEFELLRFVQYLRDSIYPDQLDAFRMIHYGKGYKKDYDESFAKFCEENGIRKQTFEERMSAN